MAAIKLTKQGLRVEQAALSQLQTYLPTLQLKKSMLQLEVLNTQAKIDALTKEFSLVVALTEELSSFLLERYDGDILDYAAVVRVEKRYENIAGVEIPVFERVILPEDDYSLFDHPIWWDGTLVLLRKFVKLREQIVVEEEKKRALEKELREVSIRVNLFEKVLIPRTLTNISKIKTFLSDQQLFAVAQSKVAKTKIMKKKSSSSIPTQSSG